MVPKEQMNVGWEMPRTGSDSKRVCLQSYPPWPMNTVRKCVLTLQWGKFSNNKATYTQRVSMV